MDNWMSKSGQFANENYKYFNELKKILIKKIRQEYHIGL